MIYFKNWCRRICRKISKTNFVIDKNITDLPIKKYEYKSNDKDISDIDIEKLLLFGLFDKDLLENDVLKKANNYVIFRERIDEIVSFLDYDNIIITSEFCNGNTILS